MMMAQPYPTGMGPGHPGMPHGHPMGGVPHPGGHMAGQPGPGMMPGMHPGVSGPQVTQGGPMTAGMPLGAGGSQVPMQNGMAMAHLGQQQHMFQQANPQMNLGQMQQANQAMMRQQMMMRQAQAAQGGGMPMNMANNPQFQQHLAQMKMGGMPMQPHHFQQMQASHIQQQQHQQRMLQQHQAQQAQQQQQQQQAQQQQHQQHQQAQQQAALRNQQAQAMASQQMQMSRSNPEPTSQPPQPQPTPAPQHQPPPPQPTPANQPQQQPAQQTPKPQPPPQQTQQQGTPQPQVKQDGPEEDTPIKQQEMANPMLMQDIKPQQPQENFTGQCILQLLLYQDQLANPDRPNDLGYWEETIQKYFSPFGSIRQQLYNNKMGNDKSFQLQYPSLARFYYSHYTSGIKQILMQSFDHNQSKLPNGGIHIWSNRASLTYVFHNDLRVTTQGSLKVSFDEMQKIEHLFIATSGWTEYIPRHALHPASPEQKASPKLNKNAKKNQQKTGGTSNSSPVIPASVVNDFGLPSFIVQFLEVAEVMTAMGPLMEYYHTNPGISPREALMRINNDNSQMNANMMRMQQNASMAVANGQVPFQQQRAMAGMMPNQLQSPALQHLGLPHGQVSPHMGGPNHTPSPAQNPAQGGVAMMHQMSAQGSNLSGSQGPSTNTSPNVSNKRRRASQIKMEDENSQQEGNGNSSKVKPSPRMGGKRQKGQS